MRCWDSLLTHRDRETSAPPAPVPAPALLPKSFIGVFTPVSYKWPQGTQSRAVGRAGQGKGAVGNPSEPPAPHMDLSHLLHEVTSCQNSYRMKQASSDSLQAETLWGQSDTELGLALAWPWHGVATCTPAAWDSKAHQPHHRAPKAQSLGYSQFVNSSRGF